MRDDARLLTGVGMGLGIYWLALCGIPSVPVVRALAAGRAWISRGDVTQVVLLATSLVLMLVLGGGPARYGFQAIQLSKVARPVLVSLVVGLAVIGLTMLWAVGGGVAGEGAVREASPGGPLKMLLSVWILASISEEVFFRGLLMGFLAPLKDWGVRLLTVRVSIPVALCALLFGLGHLPLVGIVGARMTASIIVSAVVLGLVAGHYREQTGSLLPAIAVHMVFNVAGGIVASVIAAARGVG
jgi:membrane protease YdiL (CAAX protease family)